MRRAYPGTAREKAISEVAGLRGCTGPAATIKRLAVASWPYIIWNFRTYTRIQLQLGKLWQNTVRLDCKLGKVGLGSKLYAARRIQRTTAGLWAMRGSKRRNEGGEGGGGEVQPLTPASRIKLRASALLLMLMQ